MPYRRIHQILSDQPRRWVVTGGAGFIGSHVVERLLELGQTVVVVDDFSTGFQANLDRVVSNVGGDSADRLTVAEGDISEMPELAEAMAGASVILHLAAIGSVPRSVDDPVTTHKANTDGTFRVLDAATRAGVPRVVFASSSSVYGDDEHNPRSEDTLGRPLSPYAASKRAGELYMEAFAASKGIATVSLRYFNVFGARQNPKGGYAAVIPRWIAAAMNGDECKIFGDGLTTRDFCYVGNVVGANLLAAVASPDRVNGRAFNVGCGASTTLNELHDTIQELVSDAVGRELGLPVYLPFRPGELRHSTASIDRAREVLGFRPETMIREGLERTVAWYVERAAEGKRSCGDEERR